MKRYFVIGVVFLALFALLLCTGCTCYIGGEPLRGCGYEWANCMCGRNGASNLDCLCSWFDALEAYDAEHSLAGVLNADYKMPTVNYPLDGNKRQVELSIEILKLYDRPWNLAAEICVLQDGILVGSASITSEIEQTGVYSKTANIAFNSFYDPEGQELICIVNSVSLMCFGR